MSPRIRATLLAPVMVASAPLVLVIAGAAVAARWVREQAAKLRGGTR